MAMENGPFEDVFPIVEFSIAILVYRRLYILYIHFYIFRWEVYSLISDGIRLYPRPSHTKPVFAEQLQAGTERFTFASCPCIKFV